MRLKIPCILFTFGCFGALAQIPNAVPSEPPSSPLQSPAQLETLVAPIALYPDQLLGQVLAASTYPLEIVELQQLLQRSGNLQGTQLMDAAKQQNWDPSVQGLVAFPNVVSLLTRDIQWTTTLGNALLAQQADVMDAIQRMRARAQDNGRLATTPQQVVSTQYQDGQTAIGIQPANPQLMYVPSYNPQSVWGPPAEGDYPQTGYSSGNSGFGFGDIVNIASYIAGFAGLLGSGGWGWGLNWLAHSLFLNGLFFNLLGFHGGGGGGFGGYGSQSAWVHDPVHRLGIPYADRGVAGRYGGNFRNASFATHAGLGGGWRTAGGGNRAFSDRGFGDRAFAASQPASSAGWHASQGNRSLGSQAFSNRGWNTPARSSFEAPARSSFAAPQYSAQQRFSQPRAPSQHSSARNFSTPRVSAPKFSAPRSGGSHVSGGSHFSSGGHSGGHSSGGHSGGHGHKK